MVNVAQSVLPHQMNNTHNSKIIKNPLSEEDIFELQEKFLINGYHAITFTTRAEGRSIITAFLHSFYHYTQVGCITSAQIDDLPEAIIDVAKEIELIIWSEKSDLEKNFKIGEFVGHELYVDFLWIELAGTLIDEQWFQIICEKIEAFNLSERAPILIASYTE